MARLDQRVRAAARAGDPEEAKPSVAAADLPPSPKPSRNATPAEAMAGAGVPAAGAARPYAAGLTVHYAANSDAAGAEARQVAAQIGARFDRPGMQGENEVPPKAVVRFFSPEDHVTAGAVGKALAEMGPWRIDNLSKQAPPSAPRTIEVWLPVR